MQTRPVETLDISVIIPVYNGADSLRDCLAALFASETWNFEAIVVDDGSTDGSAQIAESFPCRVIQSPGNAGPAKARNIGAEEARGRILFFLDADILMQRDSLDLIARAFREDPGIDALFGSYTKETVPRNFVSRYKNLLHHYTHQTSNEEAVTFCGGFGAIRREVFFRLGGFNPRIRFLEDVEFGHRLHLHGHRIRLLKSLQLTHCKRYSLVSLIRSDVWGRAIPWSRLILETRVVKSDLNLRPHNVLSVPLSYLIPLTLGLGWLVGYSEIAVIPVALLLSLNRRFLGFLAREAGVGFAVGSAAMLWFGYIYSGVGAILGTLQYMSSRRRRAAAVRDSLRT